MITLVEITAHDGAGPVAIRLANDGYVSKPTDNPPNAYFDPRINQPGNYKRSLFGGAATRGTSAVGQGNIEVRSARPNGYGDTLDAWLTYGFDGRPVVIKQITGRDQPLSSATIVYQGTCEQILAENAYETFSIKLYDRLFELDKPLLLARYAGTTIEPNGTAEGTIDLKDQVKPHIWGAVFNAPCIMVNPYQLVMQVSEGPLVSIVLYDAGVPLINVGDFANLASLIAANIPPGRYGTCLAQGLARPGWKPDKAITADAVEGATAADRTVAQVVRRMLLHHGIAPADLPPAVFAALDAKDSSEVGILVTGDTTALAAVTQVLGSVNGWLVPDQLGRFQVGRLDAPAGPAAAEFNETQFIGDALQRVASGDEGRGIPAWRVTVRYRRIYQVQGDNDVVGIVTPERRAFLATEWREVIAENPAIKVKHPEAREITIETCLTTQAAAQAEAIRQLAMHSVARDTYAVTVPAKDAQAAQPGASIRMTANRFGLALGKLFAVLERTDNRETDTVDLTVWG